MTQKSFVLLAIIFIAISANIELSESIYNCNDPPLDKVVSYHINRASPLVGTYLNLTGEGTCSFPITTTNKRNTTINNEIVYEEDKILQALFDRGICFLYAFEPFEAMDCFALTIERNPNCPMCYWAFARALSWNFGFRDTLIEARNRSIELTHSYNVTEREMLFINENYKDLTRLNDTNGIGFYSLSIIDDTIHVYNSPYVERCISERLTKDQLGENSENFVAQHLLMHSVEDVNNQTDLIYIRDVMSFDKFEKKSPHLEHMLGHIHFLLGDFPMANKTFFTGYKNDLKRFNKLSMPYENNWELFHNIAYLIGNLAMMGLDQEAMTRYNESLTYFVKKGEYVIPYDPVCNRVAARQYYQTGISAALAYWYFDDFFAANRTINNVASLYPSSDYTMYYYSTLGKYFTIRFMLEGDSSFNVVNATLTQFEKGVFELEEGSVNNEETYQVLARNIQALKAMLYEAHALIRYKFFKDAIGASQLLDRAIAYEQQIVYNEPPIIPLSMNYTKAILTSNYDLVTLHRLLDYPLTKNSHKVLFSLVKYYAEIDVDYDTAKSYLARIPRESLFYDRAARLIPSPTNWVLILLVIVIAVLLGGGGYFYYTKHVASPTAGGPPRKLH